MTPNDLFDKLLELNFPTQYEVDAETYGNVCQYVFNHTVETQTIIHRIGDIYFITISIGPNNGIMFRNVQLILKEK